MVNETSKGNTHNEANEEEKKASHPAEKQEDNNQELPDKKAPEAGEEDETKEKTPQASDAPKDEEGIATNEKSSQGQTSTEEPVAPNPVHEETAAQQEADLPGPTIADEKAEVPVTEEAATEEKPEEKADEAEQPAEDTTVADKTVSEPEEQPKTEEPAAPEPEKEEKAKEKPAEASAEGTPGKSSQTTDEASEEDDSDEEEHHEENLRPEDMNFAEYDKQQLFDYMSETIKVEDPLPHGPNVRKAKARFDEITREEQKETLEKFLEDEENQREDFVPTPDPVRERFVEMYKGFIAKRKEKIKQINDEKDANLRRKLEINEELKKLTDGIGKANHFDTFKKLQDEWSQIGSVPRSEADSLYKNHQFLVQKFYDNLSFYSELKDLDRKKNLDHKMKVLEQVEQLPELEDVEEGFARLTALQKEWKQVGPVPQENFEETNMRFKAAVDKLHDKRRELNEEVRKQEEENAKAKAEVLAKIKEIAEFESDKSSDWQKKNDELSKWIEAWKGIGRVGPKEHRSMSKDLREAVKTFNARKNDYYKAKKEEYNKNIEEKQALIDKVKEITKDSENLAQHRQQVINLQDEWKKTGPVPRKLSDKIWKEFRAACDAFFNQLNAAHAERDKEQVENLKKKKEVIAKAQELAKQEDIENIEEKVRELQEEFNSVGFVPFKDKDKIVERFNEALSKVISKSKGTISSDPAMLEFEMRMQNVGEQDSRKLDFEERNLQRDLQRIEDERIQLDNNLAFFSKSKTAEKMIADFRKKIDRLQNQADEIRDKIKLIRRLRRS